jgi:hypothetical protein
VKIFLAFTPTNPDPVISNVKDLFIRNGHQIRTDRYDNRTPGIAGADLDNIELCDLFIAIITNDETNDSLVGESIEYAIRLGKRTIVCIHNSIDNESLRWKLNEKAEILRFSNYSNLLKKLITLIGNNNFASFNYNINDPLANQLDTFLKSRPSIADEIEKISKSQPSLASNLAGIIGSYPSLADEFEKLSKSRPSIADEIEKISKSRPSIADEIEKISKSFPSLSDRIVKISESNFSNPDDSGGEGDPDDSGGEGDPDDSGGEGDPDGDENKRPSNSSLDKFLTTHIHNDKPTIEDKLDYEVYAFALAKFITDENTGSPICISIQAPWGAGKTSIMEMMQHYLDKEAPKLATPLYVVKLKEILAKLNILSKLKHQSNATPLYVVKLKEILAKLNILSKLKHQSNADLRITEPVEGQTGVEPRITIWFNAWKYDNTEQVWAGLADSLIKGIANRMTPVDREIFYLRLHSKRLDPDHARSWIFEKVFSFALKKIVPWIVVSIIGIAISLSSIAISDITDNWYIYLGSLVGPVFSGIAFRKFRKEVNNAMNDLPEATLGDFIRTPNYYQKLGFVHHVVKDLKSAFEVIPEDYKKKPIVVFIDDLDRCSPTKIAQVFEGINLFLAGEFEKCIFVIAMDSEMIAASLEVAHKEVTFHLPRYSNIPLGWKFMDKFIQLPITIPPLARKNIDNYITSLFSSDIDYAKNKTTKLITRPLESPPSTSVESPPSTVAKKDSFSETLERMNKAIDNMPEIDENIMKQITKIAAEYSHNPREIKRFMNLLRFYRYLMTAVENQNFDESFYQMSRWVYLSLRWPKIVRWLYQNHSLDSQSKLQKLEEIAESTEEVLVWSKEVRKVFQIDPDDKSIHWFEDPGLLEFFRKEVTEYRNSSISKGAGKGFY